MALYRVRSRVYCDGKQFEPGDMCDERFAQILGNDCELVSDEAKLGAGEAVQDDAPARRTKPIKKENIK